MSRPWEAALGFDVGVERRLGGPVQQDKPAGGPVLRCRRIVTRTFARLAAALLTATTASAQTPVVPPPPDAAAVLFDDSVLHDIHLRMNASDWLTLVQNYGRNDYYPADLQWKDQIIRNVGIRSRGSGSRTPIKPGLKIDINRYVDQRFLGLNEFLLDNLYQDFAMLRERVTMKLYAKLGLPASREAFARLFINGEYMGVYAMAESVDRRFLRRVGYNDDGYIYEFNWVDAPWWFDYLGDELEPYEDRFEPQTNEEHSYSTLFSPLEQFVRTVNEPRQIIRDIGEFLEIKTFLRYLAVEAYMAEWDGLVGDFGMNNFYFYRAPGSKQFHVIPWDKDNTFKAVDYPIWPDGMQNNVLTRQLMNVGELREHFLDAVLQCVRVADEPVGQATGDEPPLTWLQNEIEVEFAQIREGALADSRKLGGTGAFLGGIENLRDFARRRSDIVRAQVAARRR
jgi:hypothetical protein